MGRGRNAGRSASARGGRLPRPLPCRRCRRGAHARLHGTVRRRGICWAARSTYVTPARSVSHASVVLTQPNATNFLLSLHSKLGRQSPPSSISLATSRIEHKKKLMKNGYHGILKRQLTADLSCATLGRLSSADTFHIALFLQNIPSIKPLITCENQYNFRELSMVFDRMSLIT